MEDMKKRKYKYFVGDFETTVYKGQVNTEVWASAVVEMYTEDVKIHHSIEETFEYLKSLKQNIVIYYHNLKFDGAFWLSYLLVDINFTQAYEQIGEHETQVRWLQQKEMRNNTFKYSISDMGQFYTIIIKVNNYFIEIRDSLKLLPFSVAKIGKSFGTKHKKLDMEYTGFRYAGCTITDEEKRYIANDVLVVKEALEIMFNDGHSQLTIGSCCLEEFKKSVTAYEYTELFPDLYEQRLPQLDTTFGDYIRKSYRGGWCYLVKGEENKIFTQGTTADVNSLYPSMMSSESGNKYPVGLPTYWEGNFIPDKALEDNKYFFIRIKTRFYLKENYLPFIQIKGNYLYKGTESLETSDVYDKKTGKYYPKYYDTFGVLKDAIVELTLTMTDYYLILEHYELVDFEILDGCYFNSMVGIFDNYINHYKQIKIESEGAKRESAKLFLNNLYGKMASSKDSSFKVAFVKDDKSLGFFTVEAYEKEAGYIPVGSAITSYARNFTIRAAQKNYYGKGKQGFKYADTDSIHCDLTPEQINGIEVHPNNFCCWKLESCWDIAIFARQKTYIEHVTHEDCEPIKKPFYNIKCAGMPQRCKDLFELSMKLNITRPVVKVVTTKYTDNEKWNRDKCNFLCEKRTITDFRKGLLVPGKLVPVRIRGGVLLVETTYEMR